MARRSNFFCVREKIGHLRCFVLTYAINLWPKPLHLEPPPGVENESVLQVVMDLVDSQYNPQFGFWKICGLFTYQKFKIRKFLHFFSRSTDEVVWHFLLIFVLGGIFVKQQRKIRGKSLVQSIQMNSDRYLPEFHVPDIFTNYVRLLLYEQVWYIGFW